MNVFNATKGVRAISDVLNRDTWAGKSAGLINAEAARPIYFRTRWGAHTFFMKFPIDIVVLDEGQTVRILKEELKPWRFFFWNIAYRHVLELPAGMIRSSGIAVGDRLEFQIG